MNSNSSHDPLNALRSTIDEIDHEPGPVTPELALIRELLDNRLRRLEAESGAIADLDPKTPNEEIP